MWEDPSELALVRDWFYPSQVQHDIFDLGDPEDNRHEAIAKVNIWTSKSHRVPAAIVVAGDLTDAVLQHEKLIRSRDVTQYRAVQFMLAFAFLRFVNAFVDRDVAKVSTATLSIGDAEDDVEARSSKAVGESSMYAHAAAISMPGKFVDMRHRVSHGDVPEIEVLEKYVQHGLSWLRERWWKINATGDPAKALRRHKARRAEWAQYLAKQKEVNL